MLVFAALTRPGAPDPLRGVRAAAGPDDLLIDVVPDDGLLATGFDEVLCAVAGRDDLEAVVLTAEAITVDPSAAARIRGLLGADPGLSLLEGDGTWVLSRWAAGHVRFARGAPGDQVREAGRAVAAADLRTPLVSVLVPTFNRAGYLAEALESALAQTYANLEIIVGDNASGDDTAEVLAAFAARDPRIVPVVRPANIEGFPNMVDLFARARGEYVKFLLDDDRLLPTCIERLVTPMRADPSISLAVGMRHVIDADGNRQPPMAHLRPLSAVDAVLDGRTVAELMLRTTVNFVGEVTAALFRRASVPDPQELWSLDGPMDANGDVALWLNLLAGGSCFYAAEELTEFRWHAAQGGQDAGVLSMVVRDWVRLLGSSRRLGFLLDPDDERQAWAALIRFAAEKAMVVMPDPAAMDMLDVVEEASGQLRSRLAAA